MAVQKLRNYDSKHTFKWQRILVKSTLEKPQCGENQWERGSSSYFFKSGNYISKNKTNSLLISSSFSVLEKWLEEIHPQQPRNPCTHTQPYCTDCFFIKCCTVHLEKRAQNLLQPYDCRTTCTEQLMLPNASICVLFWVYNRYRNPCCIKSVPYGLINAAGCLDLRAQLCLENRASSLLPFPLQKIETLLLFLLSLNLSISHGKNEFVFGLFPPLESLSDS